MQRCALWLCYDFRETWRQLQLKTELDHLRRNNIVRLQELENVIYFNIGLYWIIVYFNITLRLK